MTFSIHTSTIDETLRIGHIIGQHLRGGEVIELISDLGGGKTTLVKGIVAGIKSDDAVQSPSFTISRIYSGRNNIELHHFDFYRLSDPGVMAGELADSLNDKHTVVIVEWADIVDDILPEGRIRITITATSETGRDLQFILPEDMRLLADAIQQEVKSPS